MRPLIAAALLALLSPMASASYLRDYNLIVGGNLTSNQEVEGRTIVRGSMIAPNSSNHATKLTPVSAFADVPTLVVGGNINVTNPINVSAGDVRIGGTRTGIINLNGGSGTSIVQNDPTALSEAQAAVAEMVSASALLRSLTSDSSVTPAGSQPASVVFNATPGSDGVAVFSFDGARFSSDLSQQYVLNLNGASSVVINVSGTNITYNRGNMNGGAFTSAFARANVIWNFYEATNITLVNQINGALLAPLANLSNQTANEGSVFVGGNFNQVGEVHLPLYTGIVPEPSSIASLGLGAAAIGLFAARRRRSASRG